MVKSIKLVQMRDKISDKGEMVDEGELSDRELESKTMSGQKKQSDRMEKIEMTTV